MKIQKTEDGFDTLFSEKYGQTFHSKYGVLQEANHVFLKGAAVAGRLQNNLPTSVLEIGFGTGFNFFLTAREAMASKTKLDFISVEKDLISHKLFRELNHDQLSASNKLRKQFLDWYINQSQNTLKGKYNIEFNDLVKLTLFIGNALNISFPENEVDAVYLDAFSPDRNPELWTPAFLTKLFYTMKPGAILSTYTAKGSVKRAMQEAGFKTIKKDGSIGKREMLTAIKEM